MNILRRVWRAIIGCHPIPTRSHRRNRERALAHQRLSRIQQRLDADLARFSQEIEDGWRKP